MLNPALKIDHEQAKTYFRFLSLRGNPDREVWHARRIAEGPDRPTDFKVAARNMPSVGWEVLRNLDWFNIRGSRPEGEHGPLVPWGAYVGVQFFDPEAYGASKKALQHLRVIALDLDHLDPEWADRLTAEYPHMVVRTKNGRHIYWRLPRRHELKPEHYPAAATAIAELCDADTKAVDVARILRVPGYWHQKDPSDPFQVHIEHVDLEARIDPFDLLDKLGARERFEELRAQTKKPKRRAASRTAPQLDPEDEKAFQVDPDVLERRCKAFRAYVQAVPGLEDGRRRKAYLLGCKAHEKGIPPREALAIIHEAWNLKSPEPQDIEELRGHVYSPYRGHSKNAWASDTADGGAKFGRELRTYLRSGATISEQLQNLQNEHTKHSGDPLPDRSLESCAVFADLQSSGILPNENRRLCRNTLSEGEECAFGAGGGDCDLDYSDFPGRLIELEPRSETSPGTYQLDLGEVEYIGDAVERVISHFDSTGAVILIDAPMGAGKTHSVREATKEGSLITLTALTALTQANAEKLEAVPYTDPTSPTAPRVATTLNSAHKIDLTPEGDDPGAGGFSRRFSFIDEAHEVLDYHHQGPLKQRYEHFKTTFRHWGCAKFPIAATANWTPESQAFYTDRARQFDRTRPTVVIKARPTARHRRRVQAVSEAALMEAFFADVESHEAGGAPIVCAISSKRKAQHWARLVRRRRPDLAVLEVTGDNSTTPEIQELLREPNRMAREYDVVIWSPAVQSGLSIEAPVKRQYVLWNYDLVVARNIIQMCMRCRNLQDTSIPVGIGVFAKREKYRTDVPYLYSLVTRQAKEARGNWNVHLPGFRVVDIRSRRMVPQDLAFTESWILQQKVFRETQNDPFEAFRAECLRARWEIDDFRDVQANEDLLAILMRQQKEVREEQDLEHARAVVAAEPIDDATAKKIDEAPLRTEEERYQLWRYQYERYYEREPEVLDVIRDDYGRHRKRCRAYNRLMAIDEGVHRPDAPDRLDHWLAYLDFQRSGSRHDAEVKTDYVDTAVAHHVLRQVFPHAFDEDMSNNRVTRTGKEIREALAPLVERNFRGLQETIGWNTRDEKQLTKAFHHLCERFGIEHETKRKRIDGDLHWVFSYDMTTVHRDSRAERSRLREDARAHTTDLYTPRRQSLTGTS